MIEQLIPALLGQIDPVSHYQQQVDTMLDVAAQPAAFQDFMAQITYQVHLGSAYLYAGALADAERQFTAAIANIQMHLEPSDETREIEVCALIGMVLKMMMDSGMKQADQFIDRADELLAACRKDKNYPLVIFINLLRGESFSFAGKNVEAIKVLTDAVEKTRKNDKIYLVLSTALLVALALAKFRVRDFSASTSHLEQALVLARQVKYERGEAEALRHIGTVRRAERHFREALSVLDEAYEIADKLGYPFGVIKILSDLGRNYSTSEPKHADFCYRKAIEIAKRYHFKVALGPLYALMGDNLMGQGRFDAAEKSYEQDHKLMKEDDSLRRKAYVFRNLGRIRHIQKKLTPAIEDLEKAFQLFESVDDKTNASLIALRLCQCYLEKGSTKASRSFETKARETFGAGETFEAALCDMMLGMIYRAEKKYEAARQQLERSLSIQKKYSTSFARVRTKLELAFTYRDQKNILAYTNELKEIIKLSRHSRIRDLEEEALDLLRAVDEKEWARMRNIVFLGVSSETQESRLVNLSVMFVDIRNYTTLTEATEVEKLADFINDFFDVVSGIVYSHNGVVNQYVGDCVMSLFGLENELSEEEVWEPQGDHKKLAACCAYEAAVDIQQSINRVRRRYDFTREVEVGIGIASGPVVAGYFGSRERMEFSVIGSAVNLASRLQTFSNKERAIICAETAALVEAQPGLNPHPDVNCKGFATPVAVKAIHYHQLDNRAVR